MAIWYIYRNPLGNNANTWLGQLGLVRTDFSQKLAYNAFKSYTPGSVGCTYEYGTPPAASSPRRHLHRRLSRRPCLSRRPTRARRPTPSRRPSRSRSRSR